MYAAIDIGTNTFRLLIAEIHYNPANQNYSLREIYSERIITRLGDGISHDALIRDSSMHKGLNALKKFRHVISAHNVTVTSAVATSALRDAMNSNEFISKAKDISGLDIRTISGEEEARLTAAGMMIDMVVPDTAMLIDIGGGSTELIYARHGVPEHVQSLDLGVVYLTSKYMKSDPPSAQMINKMEKEIVDIIRSESAAFDACTCSGASLIGTAGTITTLSAVNLKLKSFEHSRIHNSRLTKQKASNIFSRICFITSEERAVLIPFEPERLDIIVPGTLILLKLMERFKSDEIIVSDYGVREGIILELFKSGEHDIKKEISN
jgi:exopolyphosphatase/guanosine-5'-triphosphate,3'-diphosphate pyrophosphatase